MGHTKLEEVKMLENNLITHKLKSKLQTDYQRERENGSWHQLNLRLKLDLKPHSSGGLGKAGHGEVHL